MDRFWYSAKQDSMARCIWDDHKPSYVQTPDGWKLYSQWSSDGGNSNWDDAVLVYETDGDIQTKHGGPVNRWKRKELNGLAARTAPLQPEK